VRHGKNSGERNIGKDAGEELFHLRKSGFFLPAGSGILHKHENVVQTFGAGQGKGGGDRRGTNLPAGDRMSIFLSSARGPLAPLAIEVCTAGP